MDRWRNCSSGAISPSISTIFSEYISNLRSQITYLFVKFGCSICIFLNSANLICQSTDISKCFRGPLRLRDNESLLYIILHGSSANGLVSKFFKLDGYTFREHFYFQFRLPSHKGSTLREKKMLAWEQSLSLKDRTHFGKTSSSR